MFAISGTSVGPVMANLPAQHQASELSSIKVNLSILKFSLLLPVLEDFVHRILVNVRDAFDVEQEFLAATAAKATNTADI